MSEKHLSLAIVLTFLVAGCSGDPRTVGGSPTGAGSPGDPAPPPPASRPQLYEDVTARSGLDFVHVDGSSGQHWLPEEMGAGGALLDYDGDGDLDVFLVQSGSLVAPVEHTSRLFRNDGALQFTDVSAASGADVPCPGREGYGMGAAAVDYDRDGDVDLYVTRLGGNVLLQNQGDGTFVDVTAIAGVGDEGFSASAAFLDFDRDGWLDLWVTNYVEWDPSLEVDCFDPRGLKDYCNPMVYEAPAADRLYRNRGDGTFVDVSEASGIAAAEGNGLAILATDFTGDGWVDVYVANDQTPAFLWVNQRDGRFREEAAFAGAAFNADGITIAGMGTAAEDLDADGDFDLVVTNIHDQPHLALRNDEGIFDDHSHEWGFGGWGVPYTAFGIVLLDADADGRLECVVANGAVNRLPETCRPGHVYAEPNQIVSQGADGRFRDITEGSGLDDPPCEMSRSVLAGDLDNDGDVDLIVTNNRGPVQVFENVTSRAHPWLVLDVRDEDDVLAVNAIVTLHAGAHSRRREVRPHTGYLTSQDPRLQFGLGGGGADSWDLGVSEVVERVTVRWADGNEDSYASIPIRARVKLRRGAEPEVLGREPSTVRVATARTSTPTGTEGVSTDAVALPEPERFEEGGRPRARLDIAAFAAWCRAQSLPPPPAIDVAEPAVAEGVLEAFRTAATKRDAQSFGRAGMVCESLDAHATAEWFFRRAAELAPAEMRWPYYLGCVLQIVGRTDEAREAFQQAKRLDDTYAITDARLGQLALDAGDLAAAEAHFERFRSLRGRDWLGDVGLARVHLAREEPRKALPLLQNAERQSPNDFQVQYYLGQALLALGAESRAEHHLELAGQLPKGAIYLMRDRLDWELHQSLDSVSALRQRFEFEQSTGDWERLAGMVEEILRRTPGDATMEMNLASMYGKLDRYEDAHAALDRAGRVVPGSARLLRARAELHLSEGRFEQALPFIEKSITTDATDARSHQVKGRVLVMLRRHEEADQSLRQALELTPLTDRTERVSVLFVIGENLRMFGQNAQAIEAYEQVLALSPGGHALASQRIRELNPK